MPIRTAIGIGLRAIPPANRHIRGLARPSSMRASQASGLGLAVGTGGPRRTNEPDEPRFRVAAPNPQAQAQRRREIGGQALREKARQLVHLLEQAESTGERAHWERELVGLLDYLGLGDLVKGLGLGGLTQGLGEVLKALGEG